MKNITDQKTNWIAWITGFCLLTAGTLSFLYWSGKKQVWFCDEIYTYESANGFEQDLPSAQTDEWMTGKDVEAFLAADYDELSLNDITVRLYNDHVPLYFWLFRAVSLFFFKGSGTIWIGLSINLFFYLIFLAVGYLIFLRLTKSPLLSGSALFLTCIVNRLMIEQVTILRMYMMLLLAEALLLIGGLQILRDVDKNKISPGAFLYLFAVSVIGFLTHYDFWIFYAAQAALFCLWLLWQTFQKRDHKFWTSKGFLSVCLWIVSFIASLLMTIRLFRYCRWNLNKGKGQMALQSLFDFSEEKMKQIAWGYEHLSISLFGGRLPPAAGLLIIFSCIIGGGILLFRQKEYQKLAGLFLTVLTTQLYQLIVCFTMPAGSEERYLWGPFTLTVLCMAFGAILLLQICLLKNSRTRRWFCLSLSCILFFCILAVEISVIDGGKGVAYLFQEAKDINALQANRKLPWIVYGSEEDVYSYYDWIMPEDICFLTKNNTVEDAGALQKLPKEHFLLYIDESYLPDALSFFEQTLKRGLTAEYLTRSTNFSVYLVE